ncbi:phospholipase A2 inhibitor and Ly6/PLAUR domain-containing protein-like isoform X2 [Rhinoderma darwinii]|uniref:phospholipase A2 inhibitor and Ly6/PLAUR domain-containing protein-like isoform X2 n=1 Tax=Rhinoderma darwinii TaxID=43563 RepID=UPI003F66F802
MKSGAVYRNWTMASLIAILSLLSALLAPNRVTTQTLIRACITTSQCDFTGSIGIQQGQIRMVTACCNTDLCTPTIPTLPTTSVIPNGQVCRSCISVDSDWCYTSDTLECAGGENMCLLQTTKITGSVSLSTAIRGCATMSVCDIGVQSQTIGGISTNVKFICTNGGISVRKVVLTPTIACLLLLKFFF